MLDHLDDLEVQCFNSTLVQLKEEFEIVTNNEEFMFQFYLSSIKS